MNTLKMSVIIMIIIIKALFNQDTPSVKNFYTKCPRQIKNYWIYLCISQSQI